MSYEDALDGVPEDSASLRFFIGYAGWAPGQLDNELAHGSWRVLPGSSEHIFAKEPRTLWQRLTPAQEQRAAMEPRFGVY